MDLQKRKLNVAKLSVASNTSLVAMKIGVGLMIGSVSILSEAIHSAVDSSLPSLLLTPSSNPASLRHKTPLRPWKVENISGTLELC